jgi:hypothetical protein
VAEFDALSPQQENLVIRTIELDQTQWRQIRLWQTIKGRPIHSDVASVVVVVVAVKTKLHK